MKRLVLTLLVGAAAAAAADKPFTVTEANISDMRAAMEQGRVKSHDLVMLYLSRIGMYEDKLHCVITTNPHALQEADERDRERAQGRVRGPLHGIPIALKDNILTHDIVTTGGALAFDGFVPPYDATLVTNLRNAGAVILAKPDFPSSRTGWPERQRRCPATIMRCADLASIPTIPGAIREKAAMTAALRFKLEARARV